MLKLYTDTNFLTEKHRKEVFPLLFDLYYVKNDVLQDYYQIVDTVSASDIVVFPIDYSKFLKFREAFQNLLHTAKMHQKPIWIYTGGDYGFTNYIKNSYTFRLGGFQSKLNSNTFIMPSFINDPYFKNLPQEFSVLKKEAQPTMGFVGHAKSGFSKYAKELINHIKFTIKRKFGIVLADAQSFYPSSIKRAEILNKFQASKTIKTAFIFRDNYRGGLQTDIEKQQSVQDFYNNIHANAYTFCSRGVGNFSVRFYETLAVGRIPVLLNTDCKLPLQDAISWEKHTVILDENSKVSLEQQLLNFHDALSDFEFETLQKSNRTLWETHLQRPSYFIKVHDAFLNTIQ